MYLVVGVAIRPWPNSVQQTDFVNYTGFKRHVTPPPRLLHLAAVPDHGPRGLGPQGRRQERGEGEPTAGDALLPGGLGQERRHGGLLPAGGAAAPILQGTKSLGWFVISGFGWNDDKTHTSSLLAASCLVQDHVSVSAVRDEGILPS